MTSGTNVTYLHARPPSKYPCFFLIMRVAELTILESYMEYGGVGKFSPVRGSDTIVIILVVFKLKQCREMSLSHATQQSCRKGGE